MALTLSMMVELRKVLKAGFEVASMGYPDIIFPCDFPVVREDSEAICKRHGLSPRKIPDAQAYFESLGCKLDVYDIVRERGVEILIDLNEPFHGKQYDVVLDVGTLEHCFNVGTAAFNMARLSRGYIIHENPFNWGNHGFYGFSPTWYEDFYTQNGFEVLELRLVTKDGRAAEIPRTRRFKFTDSEVNCLCVAKKVEDVIFKYPVQTKYKGSIHG